MYKTKRLNKNMVDGGSYISIGDMYKGNKIILPDRWKGKGLSVPQIPKNAENGNFSRLEYRSEPYADMEKFSKTQPLDKRKLGFGTKDAFRPGEFTATIRTEQYRDLLRAEKNIMEKHRDPAKDQAAAQKYEKDCAEHRAFPDGLKEIEHLYDVGRSQVLHTVYWPGETAGPLSYYGSGHRIRRLGAHVPVAGARAHPPRQVLLRQEPPLLTAELDRGSRWSGWFWSPNLTQLVQQHFLSGVVVAVAAAPAAHSSRS